MSPEAAAVLAQYVATDPASLKLLDQARKLADTNSTLLVRGESGTGKDLLALVIHYLGPHADDPFVNIDCASLPHELIESELFGYERGAFTGATHLKRGRMEMAGEGTLVLNEVAALATPMQAKLLRVIEERKLDRLGGTRPIPVNARLISVTNVNLEQAVARKVFREDLYYRLNVVPLAVLPLRERKADILPLAEHFLAQLAEIHRRPHKKLSSQVAAALEKYDFPGNVRELRNLMERTVIQGAGARIELADLPAHVRGSGQARRQTLEDLERAYIAEILDYTRGKKSKAAEILGITRKTLLEKRKRYKLD
jgi:two-component system response regulator AtoC